MIDFFLNLVVKNDKPSVLFEVIFDSHCAEAAKMKLNATERSFFVNFTAESIENETDIVSHRHG